MLNLRLFGDPSSADHSHIMVDEIRFRDFDHYEGCFGHACCILTDFTADNWIGHCRLHIAFDSTVRRVPC